MVTKKKEVVTEKKEVKYNVQIRYRNNDVDKFFGAKSAGAHGNVLEIVEGNGVLVGIILDMVSYYNIEEA